MAYIDETGMSVPTQAEVVATAVQRLQELLEGRLRKDATGPAHRICGNMLGEAKSEVLAALQDAVSALMPDRSYGEYLTELMRLNGIDRNESAYSTVPITVTAKSSGVPLVSAGTFIIGTEAGDNYVITEDMVIAPSATDTFSARSVDKGAFEADAGDITRIVEPKYGVASVTNLVAVTPGRATESDPAARSRRWRTAKGVGMHHPSKIRSALEDLDGVTDAYVFVNSGTTYAADGTPPGSIRAVVWGGTAQAIADSLFGTYSGIGAVAAGIGTFGAQSVAVSAEGQSSTIYYDVGTDIPIYINVLTRKTVGRYPSNGDALIKSYILEFFNGDLEIEGETIEKFGPGETVSAARIYTPANVVPGHTIQAIYISRSANPSSTGDIAMDVDERAVCTEGLITVLGV